jgi:hypothetical protein
MNIHEEVSDSSLMVFIAADHGTDPDSSVKPLFVKELNGLEVINENFRFGGNALLGKTHFVELSKEICPEADMLQLLAVKDEGIEHAVEGVVIDEVSSDPKSLQSTILVSFDTIDDCLKSSLPDSVVANVNRLETVVNCKNLAQLTSSIYINDVSVQVDALKLFVFF